ncbi:TIGR03545 family protein [candidate division KSB1 bacterium]|nr:TIGR03545 family protein [candidate division KSB1 bacterium]MBL7093354.1 TIGR03545 family protein [candidate division KSB1 bacterium]
MRKKGIIILVVIFVIFAVFAFFFRDYRIEKGLEKIGGAIAGAKVEIDNFHFSLLKMECSWKRLQVADKNDPWKNILETDKASFDLEMRPLFWKRLIINEMILENVRQGTPRTTDGSLPKKPKTEKRTAEPNIAEKAKKAIEKQFGAIPVFDLSGLGKKLKIDSLINVDNLLSVQGYNRLNLAADSSFKYWSSQLDIKVYHDRVTGLEKKIKTLKLDKIKTIPELTNALDNINKINKEIKSLKKEVQNKHKALSQTFTDMQTGLKEIESDLKNDINRAKALARLKDLDVKDVSMLLFGDPVVNKTQQILDYVALGRKYLPTVKKLKGAEKEKSPPRLKGQNISFPFHYRYPKFLIRRVKLSGATAAGDTSQAYFAAGVLNGLTNEPAVYGKPTQFEIDLNRITGNQYNIKGSLDHRTEIAYDSLWISAKRFALGEVKLKKSKYFPNALKAKKGNISAAGFFIGDGINLKLNADVSPVEFIFSQKAEDKITKIVRDVLTSLNRITLKAQLKGDTTDYKMRLNSNVDQVLANKVKQTISQNLRKAQMQVENYVRAEAAKNRKKVEALIEKNKKTMLAELDKAKQTVEKKAEEFEKKKKEVEKRIEDEKKKLENQAKKKIKDLFKKP